MNNDLLIAINIIQLFANLGVILTVYLLYKQTGAAVDSTREARIMRIAEIYKSMNEQFNEIIYDLPPQINNLGITLVALREIASNEPGYTAGQAEKAIYRYFYLARTEFDLCRLGVVTDDIWSYWLRGIISSMAIPAFREIWVQNSVRNQENEFAHHFDKFMAVIADEPRKASEEFQTPAKLIKWCASN